MAFKHIIVAVVAIGVSVVAANGEPAPAALELLRAARTAAGESSSAAPILVLEGSIRYGGIEGEWRKVVDTRDGRSDERADFGLFHTESVWDGKTQWVRRRSGGVRPLNSAFAIADSRTNAWLERRGYLEPDGASFAAPETRVEGDRTFEVIVAAPAGGNSVELWFDAQTRLLARTVEVLPTSVRTARFRDYREIGGVMTPRAISRDEGDEANAIEITVRETKRLARPPKPFRRPASPKDFSVRGGKTVVPVEVDGFVAVDARINGQGPLRFILDTGGRAILTDEAARALGVETVGGGNSGGAGEGTVGFKFATIERLEIGRFSIRDAPFAVMDLSYDTVERDPHPPYAGILGLELFERLAIRIDYAAQEMTLRPLTSRKKRSASNATAIVFEDDMPLVTARIDGIEGEAAIDTGFPESLAVLRPWAERNGLVERLRGRKLQAFGAVGGPIGLWASRADLEFAGAKIEDVVAYFADVAGGTLSSTTMAGLVGSGAFAGAAVEFDYARGLVWVDAVAGAERQIFDRSGLTVYKDDPAAFIVGSVAEESPAEDAGIAVGESIIGLDGVPASSLSGRDFGKSMRRAPGTEARLTIRGEGGERSVVIVLRELIP